MASDNAVLYLVIGMVSIAIIVTPSLLATGANLWDDIRDWIRGLEDATGGVETATLGFEIYYADGSKKTFKPDPLTLLPLTISDGGGEITKIDLALFVDMRYEGTISQWSCESLLVANIKQGSTTKVGEFKSWVISAEGTTWQSMRKEIARKTVTAQQLETATSPFGEGTYNLNLIFDLSMIVDFTDGTRQKKGASAVPAIWTYEYCTGIDPDPTGAITSLNVHIGIGTLRP